MTVRARRVLRDCEAAVEMLEEEEDEQRWRILWAAAMALLRAVGHVLRKVDAKDGRVRPFVEEAWERWNSDRLANGVFWEFVLDERNAILKEYRFSVLDSSVVGLGLVETRADQDVDDGVLYEGPFVLEENLFRPLEKGFGVGEDARDVYRDALQWWDRELSRIEAELGAAKG